MKIQLSFFISLFILVSVFLFPQLARAVSQPCGDVVNFVDGVYLQRNGTNFTYAGKRVCLYGSTIYPSNGGDAPAYNWKHANFPQRIDWDLNLAQQAKLNIIRPADF